MAEPILLYAILGAVQGIVEWFPLSSSGQISLVLEASGVEPVNAVSTALWIHCGSLLAIVIRFREDFLGIARSVLRSGESQKERRTARFILIGTAFTALAGIPVYRLFFAWFSGNPQGQAFTLMVGLLLVITGIALFLGARMKGGMRGIEEVGWKDGAIAGTAQGFAVLPGISRSGFTVAALLGRRIGTADALRLSFLLDVPAILGAMILTYDGSLVFSVPMLAAILMAFLVSYVSMTALIGFARRIEFSRFCVLYGSLAAAAAAVQMVL